MRHRQPNPSTCNLTGARRGLGESRFVCAVGGCIAMVVLSAATVHAQRNGSGTAGAMESQTGGPGSKSTMNTDAIGRASQLDVEGFVYVDESGSPVLLPDMTLEKYEQLRRLQDGLETASQSHVNVSMSASGMALPGRATLSLQMIIDVASTDGRWATTPLRMNNFIPTDRFKITATSSGIADTDPDQTPDPSPDESDGDDDASDESDPINAKATNEPDFGEHSVQLTPDQSGFILTSNTTRPCRLRIDVPVSVRVNEDGFRESLQFKLPEVSTTISLTIPSTGLDTVLIGTGDEVLTTIEKDGQTIVGIEGIGGPFTLQWSQKKRRPIAEVLLDVQTLARMTWDGPQDQPIFRSRLTIENLRGDLQSFDVELPPGAILLSDNIVQSSTTDVDVRAPDDLNDRIIQVRFSDDSQQTSVELLIDLQLKNNDADADRPMDVQLPRVLDAKRQTGRLTIESSEDYRLRWIDPVFVQSVVGAVEDSASSRRFHTFEFDRGDAVLPVWLATKKRQLRLTSDIELTLNDPTVGIVMTIRPSGQVIDGRGVKIDLVDWRVRAIQELETGTPIETYGEGNVREIELVSSQGSDLVAFQIVADRVIRSDQNELDAKLPLIIESEDTVVISQSILKIPRGGRRSLVVDASRSEGLDRIQEGNGSANGPRIASLDGTALSGGRSWSQFRILPSDTPARLVATLINQPQSVRLLSDMKVKLDGDRINSTIEWPINSQFDLEGRLPVRLVGPALDSKIDDIDWNVSVDGVAALLRRIDDVASNPGLGGSTLPPQEHRYEIVSEQLNSGGRAIRWQFSQPFQTSPSGEFIGVLPVPRPDTDEVILRGAMNVVLIGDATSDLVAVDHGGQTQLTFDSLPREPLRIERRPKAEVLNNTVVRRAVIRTFLGEDVRHEQVHARVDGGQSLAIFLPDSVGSITAAAVVDGRSVTLIRRGNLLEIPLVDNGRSQSVELKAWFASPANGWVDSVEPMVRVATGVEQVYWQLITPQSEHLLWASPTIGRAMSWRFDRWRLVRRPTESNAALASWIGSAGLENVQVGNEYLYLGTSAPAFSAVVVNRTLLWLLVGSIVLISAGVLTYLPFTRHPLSAILTTIALSGLLITAPDAAVLAGQWMLVAIVLVVVTSALSVLMANRGGSRVLTPRSSSRMNPSTHELRLPAHNEPSETRTQGREAPSDDARRVDGLESDGTQRPKAQPLPQPGDSLGQADSVSGGISLSRTQTIARDNDVPEQG